MIHSSLFVSGIHNIFVNLFVVYNVDATTFVVFLKCHLIFEAFFRNGLVSFDALVTLLAGLGPVGDVGSVDLVRHGSLDRLWFIFGFVTLETMGNQMLIRF
jgi:hypothetical protein